MKKFMYFFALSSLVLITSCSKEEMAVEPIKTEEPTKKPKLQIISMGSYTTIAAAVPCWPVSGNCIRLKEVIIKSPRMSDLMTASSAGSAAVGTLFSSTSFEDITSSLPVDQANDLKSGNYNIVINYQGDGLMNFLVGMGSVSIDNYKFTVELKTE